MRDRSDVLRVAVDSEVRASVEAAQVLAVSDALRREDLATFHVEIRAAVAVHPTWLTVNLAEPDGRQLLSAARPVDAPLPDVADAETVARVVRERQPVVSDGVRGTITGDRRVGVRVPVMRDGAVVHLLTIAVRPAVWSTLLAAQDLPEGWVAAIVDRHGRLLAGPADAERWSTCRASSRSSRTWSATR